MANDVFANGREISCKAADGKSICAFPDVCFTPPENPATPPGVPIPYPNTGLASDMTNGSKTVKISGKEVMLKNKSYFKKSTGDEAGSAAKKGILTSVNRGKVYFTTWSMDVKIEGENVVRHLDLTTHNHASQVGNTCTWLYNDRMEMVAAVGGDCATETNAMQICEKKEGRVQCPERGSLSMEDYAETLEKDPCQRAARCMLSPYSPSQCCPPQTPHHLVPKTTCKNIPGYNADKAPCICAEGGKSTGTHGLLHARQANLFYGKEGGKWKSSTTRPKTWKFKDAASDGAQAASEVFPQCSKGCIEAQLKEHHKPSINDDTDLSTARAAQQPSDIEGFHDKWQNLQNKLQGAAVPGVA
jgi:hypothetical protein